MRGTADSIVELQDGIRHRHETYTHTPHGESHARFLLNGVPGLCGHEYLSH